jgi:RsiW-degrading membrane proteinase PrsW (M82 family)
MLKRFALIVGRDTRAAIVSIGISWLLLRIPAVREVVMPWFWDIVPAQQKTAWLVSIALFLGGILGLVVAFVVSEYLLLRRLETGQYTIDDIPKLDYRARLFRSIRDTK